MGVKVGTRQKKEFGALSATKCNAHKNMNSTLKTLLIVLAGLAVGTALAGYTNGKDDLANGQ